MSQPIDKLMVSLEIDEGSNLEQLWKRLEEIRQAGGKIEAEIPKEQLTEISNKITDVNRRVGQLINTLKPLIDKFPNLLENVKEIIQEALLDFTDPLNQIFQILDTIVGDTAAIRNYLSLSVVGSITKAKNDIIGALVEQIRELKDADNAEILKEVLDKIKDVWDVMSTISQDFIILNNFIEQSSMVLDGIREKQLQMNEEIEQLLDNTKDILSDMPDIDEAVTEITQLLDTFFTKRLDTLSSDVAKVYGAVDGEAKHLAGEHIITRGLFEVMRNDVMKQFDKFLQDYFDTTDTWKRFATKLDKIPQDRTETRESIKQYIEKLLVGFKNKLDQNIRELIQPQLDNFLVSLTASLVDDLEETVEGFWRAPGVLPLGETQSIENISGFFRELAAKMAVAPPSLLLEKVEMFLQSTFRRLIQDMTPFQVMDIGKFLGIELKKSEGERQIFEKVLRAMEGWDARDIIGKVIKEEEKPREVVQRVINESSEKIDIMFQQILKEMINLREAGFKNEDWQNQSTKTFNKMDGKLDSIQSSLDEPTQEEQNLKKDINKKGTE